MHESSVFSWHTCLLYFLDRVSIMKSIKIFFKCIEKAIILFLNDFFSESIALWINCKSTTNDRAAALSRISKWSSRKFRELKLHIKYILSVIVVKLLQQSNCNQKFTKVCRNFWIWLFYRNKSIKYSVISHLMIFMSGALLYHIKICWLSYDK